MSEYVVNGTFDTDLSGWTQVGTGWSWSVDTALYNGVRINNLGSLQQSIPSIVNGNNYTLSFDITNFTHSGPDAAYLEFNFSGLSIIVSYTGSNLHDGHYSFDFTADTTFGHTFIIQPYNLSLLPTESFNLDNVSLTDFTPVSGTGSIIDESWNWK